MNWKERAGGKWNGEEHSGWECSRWSEMNGKETSGFGVKRFGLTGHQRSERVGIGKETKDMHGTGKAGLG